MRCEDQRHTTAGQRCTSVCVELPTIEIITAWIDCKTYKNIAFELAVISGHLEIVCRYLNDVEVNPLANSNRPIKRAAEEGNHEVVWTLATYKGLHDAHSNEMVRVLQINDVYAADILANKLALHRALPAYSLFCQAHGNDKNGQMKDARKLVGQKLYEVMKEDAIRQALSSGIHASP